MDEFLRQLRRSRDAWFMLSWLIFPENETGPADPERLLRLADVLDSQASEIAGAENGGRDWPGALRFIARRWRALLDRPRQHLMQCPKCGGRDFRVSAELVFRVEEKENGGGRFENVLAPVEGAEPYWDRDNACLCQSCEFDGRVRDFEPKITVGQLRCIELVHERP